MQFNTTVLRRTSNNTPADDTELVTKSNVNALGLIVTSKDSDLNETTFTYDPFGNRKTVTDGSTQNVITYRYDKRGRNVKIGNPDMGMRQYQLHLSIIQHLLLAKGGLSLVFVDISLYLSYFLR